MTKNGRPVVQSIATATSVVELLARESSIGLSSAARSLGISKATLLRTLETLKSAGWVEQDPPPSWHWRLSEQFLKLGQSATSDQRLRQVSIDAMHLLNQETRETVHLAAAQVDYLVLIERLDSSFALRAYIPLGSKLPFHASATGLAYLSALSDSEIRQMLVASRPLATKYTLRTDEEILHEIYESRERGFSLNNQGLSVGISSVGAPILDYHSKPIGAISISGPTSRMTLERQLEVGPLVSQSARQITQSIRIQSK